MSSFSRVLIVASLTIMAPSIRGSGVCTGTGSLLGVLRSANLNSTADQPITIISSRYIIRRIVITSASTTPTITVGGFYTASSKSGTTIVPATQVYAALTMADAYIDATLGAIVATSVRTETTLYLSLTIAQGGAATADVFIFGDVVK